MDQLTNQILDELTEEEYRDMGLPTKEEILNTIAGKRTALESALWMRERAAETIIQNNEDNIRVLDKILGSLKDARIYTTCLKEEMQ